VLPLSLSLSLSLRLCVPLDPKPRARAREQECNVCIEATRLTVTKADYGIQFVVVTRVARVLSQRYDQTFSIMSQLRSGDGACLPRARNCGLLIKISSRSRLAQLRRVAEECFVKR